MIVLVVFTTTLRAETLKGVSLEQLIQNQGLPVNLSRSNQATGDWSQSLLRSDYSDLLQMQTDFTTDLTNKLSYKTQHQTPMTDATTVSVSTWTEFCDQVKNPQVTTIILTNNLTANSSPSITTDKTINFNNYQINTAKQTISLTQGTTTVQDANVVSDHTSSATYYSFTATQGNLVVQDTKITANAAPADMDNTNTNSTIINGGFYTAEKAQAPVQLTFDHANVSQQVSADLVQTSIGSTSDYAIVMNSSSGSQLTINDSKLQIQANNYVMFPNMNSNLSVDKTVNIKNSTIAAVQASDLYTKNYNLFLNSANDNTTQRNYFGLNLNINDHSKINVLYNNAGNLDQSGIIRIYGANSLFKLAGGSTLTIKNINGSAISISGNNSQFQVTGAANDKTTTLNATRGEGGGGDSTNPAVRFIWIGGMFFNIQSNAKVNINQNYQNANSKGDNPPGIRMYGMGNKISVSQGAEFNLHNNNAVGTPSAGESGGQGILYRDARSDGTVDPYNSFVLKDPNSQVLVAAQSGAAIMTNSTPLKIDAGDTANDKISFVARGNYPKGGIFSAPSGQPLTFSMPYPRYFDFQNQAPSGSNSYLFDGSKGSTFKHNALPLQVWDSNSDINGNPSGSWQHVGASYQSTSGLFAKLFEVVEPTEDSDATEAANFKQYLETPLAKSGAKGLNKITRMTANVTPAKVSWLQDANNQFVAPANTDKYIWLKAQVPAENDALRPGLDNEVQAELQVTLPDGTIKILRGTSALQDTYYDQTTIKGVMKIAAPDLQLLPTGTKIKILRVWRNGTYDNGHYSSSAIVSEPQKDFDDSEKTVVDQTPPLPAKVLSAKSTLTNNQTATNLTKIVPSTTELTGTADANAIVSWRILNADGSIKYSSTPSENTQVDSTGKWRLERLHGLNSGDQLQVLLTDAANNTNPQTTVTYHDTVLPGATTLAVKGELTLQVPTKLDFGKQRANDHHNIPITALDGNLAVTDTDHQATNWAVNVKLNNQANDDLGTANLPLYYGDGLASAQITTTPLAIFQNNQPPIVDNTLDISHSWTIAPQTMDDTPQGPYLKNSNATTTLPTKNHTGCLAWSLTNSVN